MLRDLFICFVNGWHVPFTKRWLFQCCSQRRKNRLFICATLEMVGGWVCLKGGWAHATGNRTQATAHLRLSSLGTYIIYIYIVMMFAPATHLISPSCLQIKCGKFPKNVVSVNSSWWCVKAVVFGLSRPWWLEHCKGRKNAAYAMASLYCIYNIVLLYCSVVVSRLFGACALMLGLMQHSCTCKLASDCSFLFRSWFDAIIIVR